MNENKTFFNYFVKEYNDELKHGSLDYEYMRMNITYILPKGK